MTDQTSERRLFPSREHLDYSSVSEIREANTDGSLKSKAQSSSSALLKNKPNASRRCCGSSNGLRAIITSIIIFSIAVTIALIVQIHYGEPAVRPHGTVASDSGECTDIGIDMLTKGGSAVDAAVAVVLCLGVVHPHITGLGGGGFMLIHSHHGEKRTISLDFRETAPSEALATQSVAEPPASVGIPGQLHGLFTAHQQFGLLAWEDVVQPAAQLAKDGFQVSSYLAEALNITALSGAPGLVSALFDTDNSQAPTANQMVRRPTLAHTLEVIGRLGASALYNHEIGRRMVSQLQNMNSVIQVNDLNNYTTIAREPLEITWKGFVVKSTPAPSSGPSLLMAFNLLRNLNLTTMDRHDLFKFMVEAMKTSAVKMAELGDPLMSHSVNQLTDEMLNVTWDEAALNNFTQIHFNFSVIGSRENRASSVVTTDQTGLYVSVISGLGSFFGSQIVTSDGIILNDALKDFETSEASSSNIKNNWMEPGKRPLSSSAAIIAYDGTQVCGLRVASAGASTNVLMQPLVKKLSLLQTTEDSVEAPRFGIDFVNNRLYLESGRLFPLDATSTDVLTYLNFEQTTVSSPFISINIAATEEDISCIHADSRGGGSAREL